LIGFEISKYKKNIWMKGTKVQRRKMRDQSDFGLLGYQVCLGIRQLEEKEEICFAYK
jgi:hypothetical protein